MADYDFTLDTLIERYGLVIREQANLYGDVAPVPISSQLRQTFMHDLLLATAMQTEKARSELLTAPLLMEVYRQKNRSVSLFSGVGLEDRADDDTPNAPDFLFSLSPTQLTIEAPVVAIVESHQDDPLDGLTPCLTKLLAAQAFNERRGHALPTLHGILTTGLAWKFLRLTGRTVTLDERTYKIVQVTHIVGILLAMVTPPPPSSSATRPP